MIYALLIVLYIGGVQHTQITFQEYPNNTSCTAHAQRIGLEFIGTGMIDGVEITCVDTGERAI